VLLTVGKYLIRASGESQSTATISSIVGGSAGYVSPDTDIEQLVAEAEASYDVDTLIAGRNNRGRPTIGTAAASVESVRLDPELRRQLIERAHSEGTTPSELIREALRRYLHAA
jgi:hypothetical protein